MAMLLRKIKEGYDFVFYELADERTRDLHYPTGIQLFTILFLYLYFVKNLGPRLVKDIKPFKLKTVLYYYNIFQIFICAYIIYLNAKGGWLDEYNYTCQPVDMTENPRSRSMINALWWYTTVKILDMLDTVFFVLRKKDRQISFLHVFHHSAMPFAGFIGVKYYPNGHATSLVPINCFVHIVMYTYYLIAGLGPKYQKYLWWKKYVTVLQLTQFCIIFVHNAVALFNSTCDYPKWILTLLCIHSIQFIYLFGSFFHENYIKAPKRIIKEKNAMKKNDFDKNGKAKVQ